jgi:uncharacterized metal-binding protein
VGGVDAGARPSLFSRTLKRACHGEAFFVLYSAMATWVRTADKVVMIDGCFLQCHGRVLKNLIRAEKVLHLDALPLYKKDIDILLMDDVPEEERKAVAREVADKIMASSKEWRTRLRTEPVTS